MSGSKQRFVETCLVRPGEFKKQSLNESVLSKAIESTDGKTYKAKAIYTFPISRPDKENLNGRVYTSKLWEKVIKEKQAEGCFGLMDHPEDDGSTKNAWCVWRDLRFSEDKKLVIADAYLFGFWGQQVLEALEAGGSVGLSTSGFGEFNDDNKTLNEETYQLERVADFVLNPSYEVFGHQEDLKTEAQGITAPMNTETSLLNYSKEIADNLIRNESIENENLESSPKSNKEIVMENVKSTVSPSIEEKSLLLNIKSMFKESKQISDVFDRIDSYNSLLSYFPENMSEQSANVKREISNAVEEDDQLIKTYVRAYRETSEKATAWETKSEELEKQVADLTEKLDATQAALKEAEDKLAVITNENAELEKKFNESCDMLDNFKVYANKQKDIVRTLEAEKNGMVSPKEFKEAIVYSQSLEEKISELKNELYEAKKAKKKEDDDETDAEEPENKGDEPEDKGDDGNEDDDLEKMDDKKSKKESFFNDSVRDYYNDLECRNPKVTLIKQDIMKCHTLLEAQMTYLRLKGLVEESYIGYSDRAMKAQTRMATDEEKQVKHTALREGWV